MFKLLSETLINLEDKFKECYLNSGDDIQNLILINLNIRYSEYMDITYESRTDLIDTIKSLLGNEDKCHEEVNYLFYIFNCTLGSEIVKFMRTTSLMLYYKEVKTYGDNKNGSVCMIRRNRNSEPQAHKLVCGLKFRSNALKDFRIATLKSFIAFYLEETRENMGHGIYSACYDNLLKADEILMREEDYKQTK